MTGSRRKVLLLSFGASLSLHGGALLFVFQSPRDLPSVILAKVDYQKSVAHHPAALRASPPLASQTKTGTLPTQTKSNTAGEALLGDVTPVDGASLGLKVEYPRLSRLTGEQGNVVIEVKGRAGAPTAVILETSGYARLDRAALEAVHQGLNAGVISQRLFGRRPAKIRFTFKLSASPGDSKI